MVKLGCFPVNLFIQYYVHMSNFHPVNFFHPVIAPSNTCMHATGFILLLHSKDDVGGKNREWRSLTKGVEMQIVVFLFYFQQYATKMLKNLLLTKPPTEMLGKSKSKCWAVATCIFIHFIFILFSFIIFNDFTKFISLNDFSINKNVKNIVWIPVIIKHTL